MYLLNLFFLAPTAMSASIDVDGGATPLMLIYNMVINKYGTILKIDVYPIHV